jgi:hypothetical protein
MTVWIIFAIVFAAGPAAFWVLARKEATQGYLVTLWVATLALLALAYGASTFGATLGLPAPVIAFVLVLSFWMAWVAMLALITLAVRRRVASASVQRTTFAIGAMATTLPWFGLYAARMVAD